LSKWANGVYNIYIKNSQRIEKGAALASEGKVAAYIALGGNIGNPEQAIFKSLQLLGNEPIIEVLEVSPYYLNAAVGGPVGQADFVNAVAHVRTSLTPEALLGRCLEVEQALGRERTDRWGPRTIDLDVVLYGGIVSTSEHCEVPHPKMRERPFVLVPLLDVADERLALPPDGMPLIDAAVAALTLFGTTLSEYRKKRL